MKKIMALINTLATYEKAVEKMFETFNTFLVLPEENKTDDEKIYDDDCHRIYCDMVDEFFKTVFNDELEIEVNFEHNMDNSVNCTIEYAHSVDDENISISFMNYHREFHTGE